MVEAQQPIKKNLKRQHPQFGISKDSIGDFILPKGQAKPDITYIYVNVEPKGARVRLLNVRPRFQNGMELEPGDYHLEVSAKYYETEKRWVTLVAGNDATVYFQLKKK